MIELAHPPAIIRPAGDLWLPSQKLYIPKKGVVPGFMPQIPPGGLTAPDVTVTYIGNVNIGTNPSGNSFVINGVNSTASDVLVLCCYHEAGAARTFTACTINGFGATGVGQANDPIGAGHAGIYRYSGSAITNATVVFTLNTSSTRGGVAIVKLSNVTNPVPNSTATDSVDGTALVTTVTVLPGGAAVCLWSLSGAVAATVSGDLTAVLNTAYQGSAGVGVAVLASAAGDASALCSITYAAATGGEGMVSAAWR